MSDPSSKSANSKPAVSASPGFLVIALGGAGKLSASSAIKQHRAENCPFLLYSFALDTEPTGLDGFDSSLNIAPTREAVQAMAVNPRRYGPACTAIATRHRYLLEGDVLGMGARSSRIITQAAFELNPQRIVESLRSAIHALLRQGRFERIQPVVVASSGGGTGSAAVVLITEYFADTKANKRMLLGLPSDLVAKPVAFLLEAYAHAIQQQNEVSPDWILSNSYAARVELAEREKRGLGYQYTFHLGLGNASGAVFPSIEEACEINGLLAWEWMANYAHFKMRAVDQLDFYAESCRYHGDDVPELFFPPEELPPYAQPPQE
jgi:hypothetical protein